MRRYFLEVSYFGKSYAGFQVQRNALTIQSVIEQAFNTYFKSPVYLTGSSRTDAGVHAYQNFFHFDWPVEFDQSAVYNLNAILPPDVAIRSVREVSSQAHARFSASSRVYEYVIYKKKDPFLTDRAWYFPYSINTVQLSVMAEMILGGHNFIAFSKRNTQVKTFNCNVINSEWLQEESRMTYKVEANRFLRGMVRGLVGTMLRSTRGNRSIEDFQQLLLNGKQSEADFSAPAHGLYLKKVVYPSELFL